MKLKYRFGKKEPTWERTQTAKCRFGIGVTALGNLFSFEDSEEIKGCTFKRVYVNDKKRVWFRDNKDTIKATLCVHDGDIVFMKDEEDEE